MPRNWGPFPPGTHLWEKLFQEALASSPDEEAGKQIRQKQSGATRTTHSWFVKGLPLNHSNQCLQVSWKSWIYPTSSACSSIHHSFTTDMIAKQLCSHAPDLKNKLLLLQWKIHNHARNPLLQFLHSCLLLPYRASADKSWLINCMSRAPVVCSCSVVCHSPFLSILLQLPWKWNQGWWTTNSVLTH